MLATLLLAGLCGVSAMLQNDIDDSGKLRQKENCEICYGSACLTIDEARCEYYTQAESILRESSDGADGEESEIKTKVDNYIMDYVDEDSWTYTDCIPLFSEYSNCNRENICTGCQYCHCDNMGKWNCTMTQRCYPDDVLDINNKTLAIVMEKLQSYKTTPRGRKTKRSVVNSRKENNYLNYEDILKSLYGVESFENTEKVNSRKIYGTHNNIKIPENITDYANVFNTQPLDFEELLNNINYKNMGKETDVVNAANTTIMKSTIKNKNTFYVKSVEIPAFDYLHNLSDGDNRNLKKREVAKQMDNNTSTLSLLSEYNSTKNIQELKDNVIYPLFNMIKGKRKELEQLNKIKENLVVYFKSFTDINVLSNVTNSSETNDNLHLYFYQLEMPIQIKDDTRKSNSNILDKYLTKLKRDIFEVTKDIAILQRFVDSSTMPHDLKVLIQAMRYYVNKEKQRNRINKTNIQSTNLRKEFDEEYNSKQNHAIDICINIIFEMLNRSVAKNSVLEPVSQGARRILTRVIKQFYVNDVTNINTQLVFDPQYDVNNVLKNIGEKWCTFLEDLPESSLSDRLYYIKLVHIEINADIKKIKVILELLQFAQYRRMVLLEDAIGEKIISQIGNYLERINSQVNQVMQLHSRNRDGFKNKPEVFKSTTEIYVTSSQKVKKKSFIQNIKKLLRNSKQDIRDLFHKKDSKSKIIKRIAKKKSDEMTKKKLSEYIETMQKWQNNLNVVSVRNKRSAEEISNFFNRFFSYILPGYLKQKVKPAVIDKGKNKHRNKTKDGKKPINYHGN